MQTVDYINEFKNTIDNIYGTYLDSTKGYHLNKDEFEKNQIEASRLTGKTIDELDSIPFVYGKGRPGVKGQYDLHQSSQKEFKERNSSTGRNFQVIGNLCITQVYDHWEDYYRQKIAESSGKTKNEVKSDIFADLKHLRHDIIHHRAIATKEHSEKCQRIGGFKAKDIIHFTEDNIEHVVFWIKLELDRFK